MDTIVNERKPHSAEYFGETRNFWWNSDFLALMAKRLRLDNAKTVLDVGCGLGHWSQALASVLSKNAVVTGVDREEAWVEKAATRAKQINAQQKFEYLKGNATDLPFEDNLFDLVTCQTVLIHLKDPHQGLREMLRVLRPGGTLLIAEPNNLANRAIGTSLTNLLSIDEIVDRLRFELTVERGKQAMGLGFNSVGDLIPGHLAELGAEEIRVYLSDKATPMVPPYATPEQKANIEEMTDWDRREFIGWDRNEVRKYFLAGGGHAEEFDGYHSRLVKDGKETLHEISRGHFHSGGGGVTYLVTASKADCS